MNKPRIYLAGPITNNHWRTNIYPERDNDIWSLDDYKEYEHETNEYIVTGAHAISCDHRCYHLGKHVATNNDDCYGDCLQIDISEEDVVYACTLQIEMSDAVFAYIDSLNCVGTFAEIGYAYACGKDIYILFANTKLEKELWFIANMSNKHFVVTNLNNLDKEIVNVFKKVFKLKKDISLDLTDWKSDYYSNEELKKYLNNSRRYSIE